MKQLCSNAVQPKGILSHALAIRGVKELDLPRKPQSNDVVT